MAELEKGAQVEGGKFSQLPGCQVICTTMGDFEVTREGTES